MVQVEDHIYAKLQKDADDNRQIIKIISIIVGVIIFGLFFFTWGVDLIKLDIQKRNADLQMQIAITQAETNKRVMSIEKEGLTTEEYFKWLEVRNDN